MGQVGKELAQLQAQLAAVTAELGRMQAAQALAGNRAGSISMYRDQIKASKGVRDGLNSQVGGFNEALRASGAYQVETVKAVSRTQALSKAISDQKLTMAGALRNMKNFREAWREQNALQQASAMQWGGGSSYGKNRIDMYMPTGLGKGLDDARVKYGFINQAIGSIGTQTVNWGKNTQWAGRQLTVGLGVPIAIIAGAMGALALEADKQLTRIAKVYDTTVDTTASAAQQMVQREQELSSVRADSMTNGMNMARQYGAAVNDTLQLTADLAAVGYQGAELQETVAQVTRISTLGELDHQAALDMTITLMSAYKQSASELTDTFNYMNAIENATSLSTQDFAEALPRAGGALANLGVDIQDFGVLMVALKEGGVGAAEGANALKSATTRLLKPTADATQRFHDMGISLESITAQAGGNLMETLGLLYDQMEDVDPVTRQAGIAALFGTYQFNRLNVALDNVGSAMNGTASAASQTAAAMAIAEQSGASWANTADQEIQTFQQSVSGRFKRAIETIKAEMTEMGTPIIAALAPIIEGVATLFAKFNQLPDGVKKWTVIIAVVAGLAGPAIMLLGLFGNLAGQVLKFGSTLGMLVTRFKVLTPQQRAEEIMAKRAASAFTGEAGAVAMLNQEMRKLTATMSGLQAQQRGSTATTTAASTAMIATPTRNYQTPLQNRVNSPTGSMTSASSMLIPAGKYGSQQFQSIARDAEKARVSTMGIVGGLAGLALGVSAFSQMKDSSQSFSDYAYAALTAFTAIALLQASGVFGAIGGMFKAGIAGVAGFGTKFASVMKVVKAQILFTAAVFNASFIAPIKAVPGLFAKIGVAVKLLSASLMKIGIVGLVIAAAVALAMWIEQMDDAQESQEALNKSTEDWANTLGYVKTISTLSNTGITTDDADEIGKRAKAVDSLMEANEGLANAINDAAVANDNFASAYDLAVQEALKVRLTGGSAAQAKEAFKTVLTAAGVGDQTLDDLTVRFSSVNLDDPNSIRNEIQDQVANALSSMPTDITTGGIEGWATGFFGDDVSDEAVAAGMRAANLFATAFAAEQDGAARTEMAIAFNDNINDIFDQSYNSLAGNNQDLFREAGITNATEFYAAWNDVENTVVNGGELTPLQKQLEDALLFDEDAQGLEAQMEELLSPMMDTIGDALQLPDSVVQGWKDKGWSMARVLVELGSGTQTVTQATGNYQSEIDSLGSRYDDMTEAEKLAILNKYRIKAGMDLAATSAQGFANALDEVGVAAASAGQGLTRLDSISLDGLDADVYTNMVKSQYSQASSGVLSGAADLMQKTIQASNDAISAQGDRTQKAFEARGKAQDKAFEQQGKDLDKALDAETKAFDKAWDDREKSAEDFYDNQEKGLDAEIDAVKAGVDARTDAINDEIDMLQKADDEREKMFEREKKRIQRMAELNNSNIDFNSALNKGDFDSAAKIYTTNQSRVQQYNVDDQAEVAGDASKNRQDQLKNEIDNIKAVGDEQIKALEIRKDALKEAKEFRLAQLKEERDAESEALKERQQQAKDELSARKEMASEALANSKANAAADTQNRLANNQAQWADKQQKLDWELAAIKASTPRNQAEYDEQIRQIEAAYATYGVNLQAQGTAWSGVIGGSLTSAIATSAAATRDQIAWAEMGVAIANQIQAGAGITMADLVTYLQTGTWPAPAAASIRADQRGGGVRGSRVAHSGGPAGGSSVPTWSQADRVGVPRSASLFPSEIPTILKQGEFVVNAQSARKNMGILTHINSKGTIPYTDGSVDEGGWAKAMPQPIFRHSGGIADNVAMGFGGTYAAALQEGMWSAVDRALSGNRGMDGAVGAYNGPVNGNINNVLSVARSQQGKPYIWGGAGASGSDCSGFMSIIQNAIYGKNPPYGRRWATASFTGGKEQDGWKRGGTSSDVFRIGVQPGSHVAGTLAGLNVESGSGHGPMVGGRSLGADDRSFSYRYYLPAANQIPGLRTGGNVLFDNTLANLHKGETVLTAPLTQAFQDNVASGGGNEYNVKVEFNGPVNQEIDVERAIRKAMDAARKADGKRVVR